MTAQTCFVNFYIHLASINLHELHLHLGQSAGAAEYTDSISAKGKDSPNECPGYNTKKSDDFSDARDLGNAE